MLAVDEWGTFDEWEEGESMIVEMAVDRVMS